MWRKWPPCSFLARSLPFGIEISHNVKPTLATLWSFDDWGFMNSRQAVIVGNAPAVDLQGAQNSISCNEVLRNFSEIKFWVLCYYLVIKTVVSSCVLEKLRTVVTFTWNKNSINAVTWMAYFDFNCHVAEHLQIQHSHIRWLLSLLLAFSHQFGGRWIFARKGMF